MITNHDCSYTIEDVQEWSYRVNENYEIHWLCRNFLCVFLSTVKSIFFCLWQAVNVETGGMGYYICNDHDNEKQFEDSISSYKELN